MIPLLSEEEMNKLGAKLVKAELLGNTVRLVLSMLQSDTVTVNGDYLNLAACRQP